jgi:hypothetical protein
MHRLRNGGKWGTVVYRNALKKGIGTKLKLWDEPDLMCFLQALFGQSCKIFLDIVASPNWTKLQRHGCPVLGRPNLAIADNI